MPERELLMGLHGGVFYSGMRRWVYAQAVFDSDTNEAYDKVAIRNQVRAYLQASKTLLSTSTQRPKAKEAEPWH